MRQRATRVVGAMVFGVAAILLTSIGGLGIAAGPITLPVMYGLVAAHPSRPFRVAGVVIGGLTALEGGWGLGFLLFGRQSSATVATMLIVAIAAVALFATAGRTRQLEY